jgi:hypothetical protein
MAKKKLKMKHVRHLCVHPLPQEFGVHPGCPVPNGKRTQAKRALAKTAAADFTVDFEFLPPGNANGQETQPPATNATFNLICSLDDTFVAMFAYFLTFNDDGSVDATSTGHVTLQGPTNGDFRWTNTFQTPGVDADYLYTVVAFFSPPGGPPVVRSISAWFTVQSLTPTPVPTPTPIPTPTPVPTGAAGGSPRRY